MTQNEFEQKAPILLVDDDPGFLALCSKRLERLGYAVTTAASCYELRKILSEASFELILLDLFLPDGTGTELTAEIKATHPDLPIVVLSGSDEVPDVVKAMQSGASDYLKKPLEFEQLKEKIASLLAYRHALHAASEMQQQHGISFLVHKSLVAKRLVATLARYAHSNAPVLLQGESGTGKSLVAHLVHSHGSRKDKPFVTVHCAAIPEELLESELFGYEKGAFTGAFRSKIGRCEMAQYGTLFLDEIGELSPRLQAKILRLVQSQEFERVGGLKTIQVDVRVIAATNRPLEDLIGTGQFREDLYYRLNVLPVLVPALRERKEDIPFLLNHFLQMFSRKSGKIFHSLSPEVVEWLVQYDWPGNIRELENTVQRAVILGKEPTLLRSDFVLARNEKSLESRRDSAASVDEIEQQVLIKALRDNAGNISKAAKQIGISRDTVYRRLKKYGIGLKGQPHAPHS